MTKTRINKLLAMFLTVLMTIAFGTFVPMNKVKAASQADALVSVALAEEGYTEGSNNYSKYGEWYYNNVSQSIDYSHADWCAMFISWCARQAGIPTSIIKNNAWAGSMSSSKRTGNFGGQYYPKGSITPQKGDIAYYGWGSSSSQHVEIVISTSGNTFTSIGGNTGGGTKVYVHKNYSFTSSDVVGFERPNYDGNTPYPEYIDVNISPGTSNTPSKFSWEESKGANNYYLRIFNSAGTKEVISVWGTDGKLSWDLQLDAGEYTAQVGAISASNSDYVTWSGLKSFVVEYDPYPAYVDVNITAGTSNTPSKFSWEESKGANNYYLRIFNSAGTKEVISVWGTDGKLSWDLQLDAGEYTAQVGAISASNSDYVTWSGLKSFVVEYDPYPAYVDVNITAGTSNTPSKFSWEESKGANNYYLRIFNSAGTKEVISVWGTDGKLSWDLQLDAGEYTAQVGAISASNSDYVTWSGLKSFVVEYDPYPAYVDVNITVGTSNTPSKFSWEESKGANNYYLRIFNSAGTKEVISVWGTDGKLSWDLQLDAGEYTAQVGAISASNSDYVTWSGLKAFVVKATPIVGDINSDGKFNISDAVLLQKWLVSEPDVELANWKAADLCEDGRLNVFDLCLMKQMLIEKS